MSPLFLSLRPQSPQYCINASFPYNLILPSHFFAEHTYVDNMKILSPLFSLSLHPQIPNPSSFFASPIPDPSPPNIAIMHPLRRSPSHLISPSHLFVQIRSGRIRINSSLFPEYFLLFFASSIPFIRHPISQ